MRRAADRDPLRHPRLVPTPGTHYTLSERSADLASSLSAVFDAPQRWDSQACSGLAFAKQHTWSQSANRLAHLVHSVAKQRGKPARPSPTRSPDRVNLPSLVSKLGELNIK